MPKTGVALDIGAGFGVFALPFAAAYPGWTVWCFEPAEATFAALCENIAALGLTNLIAVNGAVGPATPDLSDALSEALNAKDPAAIQAATGSQDYFRHKKARGFMESNPPSKRLREFEKVALPAFPANALPLLRPDLVKFIAPGVEEAIVEQLTGSSVSHMVGESWNAIPSRALFAPRKTPLSAYIPLAGTPLRLHRWEETSERQHGLDVAVALYNSPDYILDCVDSIIGNDCADIRALVIDDGSTDESSELVKEKYRDNPRVLVHHKPNGGCASARNFGRLMSDRTHITFMDADDTADKQLFPELLELARYSGAELTQGGFDLMYNENGGTTFEPSYEADEFAGIPRQDFGARDFFTLPSDTLPSDTLMTGQPSIWRRIYRRDFLDNKNIWFPEHIRAFDDQIFQMLSLQYVHDVYCMDHVKLHYRQHPGQDIRKGDERGFYALEMFRMTMKRGLAEGWNDFQPILQSYVNTVNWVHGGLRDDLQPTFLKGAAELWVYMQKSLGPESFRGIRDDAVAAAEFGPLVEELLTKLRHIDVSYAWAYLDRLEMHPGMVRAVR